MADERSVEYNLKFFGDITDIEKQRHSQGETIYTGKRKDKHVTIYIIDQGASNPHVQYMCEIKQEDVKTATGNGAPNPEEAIAAVHWNALD